MKKREWEIRSLEERREDFFARLAEEYEREEFKREFDEFWDKIEDIGRSLRTKKYKNDLFWTFVMIVVWFFVGVFYAGLVA